MLSRKPRPLGAAAAMVLQAVANGFEYGFDVMRVTALPSGTVYPALARLDRDRLVQSAWEHQGVAHAEGRPARRYYRITLAGQRLLAQTRERLHLLLTPVRPSRIRD